MELLSELVSVKSLKLTNNTIERFSYPRNCGHLLPSFNNLTKLDMILGYFYVSCELLVDILRKTPKLEVLHISKGDCTALDNEDLTSDSLPCCIKSSLKLCSFSDFDGDEIEIQLLKCLTENATVLEAINIFCSGGLSSNLKKLTDVRNHVQSLGLGSCVFKFH
ncbi:putative FBD domain-containing protein [Medicago truncatula]|nr:putative FBD domain-containing protein [Medicago truncatula]